MKLIKCSDYAIELTRSKFVKEKEVPALIVKERNLIMLYANFIKRPLELGMFIACDKDGNVLEMPQGFYDWHGLSPSEVLKCKQYQEALDRVLFEGLTYEDESDNSYRLRDSKGVLLFITKDPSKTVEILCGLGLTLKREP